MRWQEQEGKTMLRISKESRLAPDEILARASRYFGKGGEGLDETERGSCCISFAGGGGYVTVMVSEEGNLHREVDVESREFEYQARQFLSMV
jgi:hypothetical protein